MSSIKVRHQSMGSNITHNPLQIKKVKYFNGSDEVSSDENIENKSEDVSTISASSTEETPMSDADRRAKRREEYREAASIRERALQMQKQAEQRIKETEQFASLMQQAKEDPTVLAKALNMDLSEFQRKLFNKTFSIQEDAPPAKEETFEEQTKRRLEQYEQELSRDRERRAQADREEQERSSQQIKHAFITNNILPCITENHEFIARNDKYSCGAMVYDLMNQAYQQHIQEGGSEANFTLRAQDVVDQMEEELQRRAEEELTKARSMKKLQKFFNEEDMSDSEFGIKRKDFSQRKSPMTLSRSLGTSVPPSITSSSPSVSERKLPLGNRSARLERAKKMLGS